jgi:tetratricopeptide (TPR) repeat protein
MILSGASQFEGPYPAWEEHFLERISALEHVITRLEERLNEFQEVARQLATESFYDHTMVETIVNALKRGRMVGPEALERDWQRRVTRRIQETEDREKMENQKRSFLVAFRGKEKKLFLQKVEEATGFLLKRDYQRGLQSLEKAFAADPGNSEIGLFLSKIYYQMENYRAAGKHLQQVLKLNPQSFEANLLSGMVARRKGNLKAARDRLSQAVASSPASLAARLSLGTVLLDMGEDQEAVKCFSQALALNPSPHLHLALGSLYTRQGRTRHAIRHMKKALEIDPQCGEAFYQLGLAFLAQDEKEKARECFHHAFQLDPREGRYRTALHSLFRPSVCRPRIGIKKEPPLWNVEKVERLIKDELQLDIWPLGVKAKGRKSAASRN